MIKKENLSLKSFFAVLLAALETGLKVDFKDATLAWTPAKMVRQDWRDLIQAIMKEM